MNRVRSLDDIVRLYAERGERHYGEGVTQTEHALQCAGLAEAAGSDPSLVAAALLHDIGHLLEDDEAAATEVDDRHEIRGARALADLFAPAVRRPIALHVAAKRYLCVADPGYLGALSPASTASLALQGGPLTEEEAKAFQRRPGWQDAVVLRRFDELAKGFEACGRSWTDYMPLLESLAAR